jgi:SAM-dependent methyltransferase
MDPGVDDKPASLGAAWWLASWDQQQERLLPDREERFAAMLDLVEAVLGSPAAILDLAGGPGSITMRLRRRFPDASLTLVDVDPSLLAIATGVLGDDRRVRIVRVDLAEAGWAASLPSSYDAVLTANSLHWLEEPALRRLYGDLARLIRAGGLFCNADPMPPEGIDTILGALDRYQHQTHSHHPGDELDWEGWWQKAAADPVLAPLVEQRNRRFGGESHPPDFTPPIRWHEEALRAAGFREAGCVWRHGEGAIVAALR